MEKIGVFDSGVGGFTVMKEILSIMPEAELVYYMDDKNCPYGSKGKRRITRLTEDACKFFKQKNCDAAVLACNTATAVCVDYLRQKFDYPIIGTEPALKQASGYTVLLATPAALKEHRIKRLFNNGLHEIAAPDCTGLAAAVQEHFDNLELALPYLDCVLKKLRKTPDCIVLGCTHYVYFADYLKNKYPYARVIDGNRGVAEQTKRVCKEKANNVGYCINLGCNNDENGIELFCTSGENSKYSPFLYSFLYKDARKLFPFSKIGY